MARRKTKQAGGVSKSPDRRPATLKPPGVTLRLAPVPAVLAGLGLLSTFLPMDVRAQAFVNSVSPANATHSASIDTDVSATLSAAETSDSLSRETFAVRSTQTPIIAIVISGSGTAILTEDPGDFKPGEWVQATVTDGIQTSAGAVVPYVWTFRTQVTEGSGVFIQSANSLGGSVSRGAALGDLDRDGDLDAFVVNSGQADRVWLNAGSGTFSASANSLGGSSGNDVALGDLNGDGELDAFVANTGPNQVWLNAGGVGGSTFIPGAGSLGDSASRSVSLGDVDGDGDLDAFVANYLDPDRVWLNEGGGTFAQSANSLAGSNTSSFDVGLGDLDGDGDLDAYVTGNTFNRVWLNSGNGTFDPSANTLTSLNSSGVSLGDVDGDGDLDAFVANSSYAPNRVMLNAGSGTFSASANSLGDSISTGVSLGDVDGDGDLDAFVTNNSQANRIWLNAGSGTFSPSTNSLGGSSSYDVALGDVDDDGDLDAFVANALSQANRVWLNVPDSDSDGIVDINDNCPGVANADQKDMNNDGEGNACDDDVDGDGTPNATDDDDDNDGLADVDEAAQGGLTFDPDTDNDGVIDGLDRDVDDPSNVLSSCTSILDPGDNDPDGIASLNASISDDFTCAATVSITTIAPAAITATGDLLMISPEVSFGTGFSVETGGRLQVIAADPTDTDP